MAAELAQEFPDARIDMVPSAGGRFEVTANGVAVFEKSKLGRHAQPGEIARAIRAAG